MQAASIKSSPLESLSALKPIFFSQEQIKNMNLCYLCYSRVS